MFSATFVMSQSCGQGGSVPSGSSSSSAIGGVGDFSGFNPTTSLLNSMMNDIYSGQYLASISAYEDINGSPYLLEESSQAVLVMNDGQIIENVPVKYDIYTKEIIATKPNGEDIVLDTRYYQEMLLTIDGQEISFKKVNPKSPDKFFEVLYQSGDVAFFKDQTAKLRKGENLGITRSPSSFNQYTRYYVTGDDDSIAKVNLKKRDVFDHFPEMEAVAMREYVKTSKIKLSKEKDYKKLFAAMDDD